jgi:AhpD family alkylhydroperoxidase
MSTGERIKIKVKEPEAYKVMLGMEHYIRNSQIPLKLMEMIKIRASQINGCAYCIDMHALEALEIGEDQRRIFALSAWKESPLFTEEERAVLQLTDEVTLISKEGVSDATYKNVLKYYGETLLAQIIMQIIIINSWNRIAISTGMIFEPGK